MSGLWPCVSPNSPGVSWVPEPVCRSVEDDGVDVAQAQDHELAAVGAEFGAAVFGEEHGVAFVHVHRLALTGVEQLAAAGCQDLAALALFLGGVRQYQAAGRGLRFFDDFYDHLVAKGPEPEITVSHSLSSM